MTIKELENKTGMTRANIRFYEGEGLLHPKRLDNGYRDYSEEDQRTLEKIKLLRQLQLDLDTIRKVQQGTLTLEQALFAQMNKLEGDRAVIQRAAQVCQALEQSGVEYAALDPQPWLRQLAAPIAPPVLSPPPKPRPVEDNTPRACYHPWQRYFARLLDINLYRTVFEVLWLVLLRDQSLVLLATTGPFGWLLGLLGLAFALAVEPLWLHFWGWTPGKWVFGLKLRREDGEKLTLAQGVQRSRTIIWEGYGLNIPIYGLWRFWKCREMGLEGRDCHWDGENDYRYIKEERRIHPAVIYIIVGAVSVGALFMGLNYTETPPNQGPLTVEAFAENYNYYLNQLRGQDSATLPKLGEDGRWVKQEEGPLHAVVEGETFNGMQVRGDTIWDEPLFTLEDGRVTAVTLFWESDYTYLFSDGWRETLALLALSGSAEGTDLFRYDLKGWLTAAEVFDQWGDCAADYRGLRIDQRMEYTGYYDDGRYLFATDGEEQHCERVVTISLIES